MKGGEEVLNFPHAFDKSWAFGFLIQTEHKHGQMRFVVTLTNLFILLATILMTHKWRYFH